MSLGKQVLRNTKNLVKGYTDIQVKVREATSNDPWGPAGKVMHDIADATYNHKDFMDTMEIIDKRLNDSGKNWRHVFKALILLDYLLHAGSEAIMSYAKENFYVIKTLKEFQYVDEEGKDQGANVRQKSKEIMMLLADEARLKEERKTRKDMVARMGPTDDWGYGNNDTYGTGSRSTDYYRDADLPPTPPPARPAPAPVVSNDDAELQRALEESRRSAMEDEKKRSMLTRALSESEDDLQKAIRLSQADARAKEEEMRRQMARRQQEQDLFDFNTPAIAQQPNQMYQRTDSMPNMGYGQPDYNQGYGFGNDFAQQQQYEANPFGIGSSGDGFGNPFGAAFDGGSGARPLPHQIAGGTPNAQMASIARNAIQIDPFANLASSRAPSMAVASPSTFDGYGSATASNPFGAPAPVQDDPFGALSQQPRPAPTRTATGAVAAKPASRFTPTMNVASNTAAPQNYGMTSSQGYGQPQNLAQANYGAQSGDFGSLVNLSSSALASAPRPSSNNPFGASSADAASSQFQWNPAPQPSLNDMSRNNGTQPAQAWGQQPAHYPYGGQQAQQYQTSNTFF